MFSSRLKDKNISVFEIILIFSVYTFLCSVFLLAPVNAQSNSTTYILKEKIFISNQSVMLNDTPLINLTIQTYNQTWLDFDGTNKISVPFNMGLENTGFTISLWTNKRANNCKEGETLFGRGYEQRIYLGSNSPTCIIEGHSRNSSNSGKYIYNPKMNLSSSLWHNVIYVYYPSINQSRLYLDGKFVNNIAQEGLRNEIIQSTIGGRNTGDYFNGSISKLELYNKSLSPEEIQAIYDNGLNQQSSYRINIDILNNKPEKIILNKSFATFNASTVYIYNDTRYYALIGSYLRKSDDRGKTWSKVKLLNIGSGAETIFIDSRKNIFLTTIDTGNISRSNMENDSKWTEISVMKCKNESGEGFGFGTDWAFTETKNGTLLLGEYGSINISRRNCSVIHRSTDRGLTWEITYDGTEQFPESPGRHIHLVKTDPYTGYVYATQGDSPESRLLRSVDDGKTWKSLENISSKSQYLSLVFTPKYRIFGTDKWRDNSIVRTKDDITFETVYSLQSYADAYFWDMERDNITGLIIAGTQSIAAGKYSSIFVSPDNGTSWFSVYEKIQNKSYQGITKISQFNSKGYGYYYDNDLKTSFYFNLIVNYNKSNILYPYGIKNEGSNKNPNEIFVNKNGALYGIFADGLKKSNDNGVSWSTNLMPIGTFCEQGLFIDSRSTIFCTEDRNNNYGLLRYSVYNDTNWKTLGIYTCINSSAMYQSMAEDSSGNLYLGEYTYGHSLNCSYIYKSVDNGETWSIVYNGSQDTYGGRHVHFVKSNPYNKCLYSSIGDSGIGGASSQISRLIRSCDSGKSWNVLLRGNVDYQFLALEFTKNYSIFGTDSPKNNKIYRTMDDVNFEVTYNFNSPYDGQPHILRKDNQGFLYLGTTSMQGNKSLFLFSADQGKTWETLLHLNSTKENIGFDKMSNFDKDNFAYLHDNFNNIMIRYNLINNKFNNFYKFAENTGATLYDSSGKGNNGAISGGAWKNDGILITLKEGVDYTFNEKTRELIPSNKYLYSWFNATYKTTDGK